MKCSILLIVLMIQPIAFAGHSWSDYNRAIGNNNYTIQQPLNGPEATKYYRWRQKEIQKKRREQHRKAEVPITPLTTASDCITLHKESHEASYSPGQCHLSLMADQIVYSLLWFHLRGGPASTLPKEVLLGG